MPGFLSRRNNNVLSPFQSIFSVRERIILQKSHPARLPRMNPTSVRSETVKLASPWKNPLIEPTIAPRMPNEIAVPITITLNKLFSCSDLSRIEYQYLPPFWSSCNFLILFARGTHRKFSADLGNSFPNPRSIALGQSSCPGRPDRFRKNHPGAANASGCRAGR